MKHVIVALTIAAFLATEPALAGTVADPAMEPEIVAQAAVDDATVKTDLLLVTLGYIVFLMMAGGAF